MDEGGSMTMWLEEDAPDVDSGRFQVFRSCQARRILAGGPLLLILLPSRRAWPFTVCHNNTHRGPWAFHAAHAHVVAPSIAK